MKYDFQLSQFKSILPTSKRILIALPSNSSIDKLAAGLALYLSLEQQGKEVSIVCEDTLKVGQAHLFGIDRIKQTISNVSSGGFVISLEGVEIVEEGGRLVPKSLEKLDWYGDRNNVLNLVFSALPGQTFQPTKVTPQYQSAGYEIVFTIGAVNPAVLGNMYAQNMQLFSNAHLVNIDNDQNNANYGQTNIVDTNTAAVSEIMTWVMADLGLFVDGDIATNLIAGIFDATNNLTNEKAGADTYAAVAQAMRSGGKKPQVSTGPASGGFDLSAFIPQSTPQNAQPQPSTPTANTVTFDQFIPQFNNDQQAQITSGQTAPSPSGVPSAENTPSPEERPRYEGVSSSSEVEPDWLTPKVFKGSSIG